MTKTNPAFSTSAQLAQRIIESAIMELLIQYNRPMNAKEISKQLNLYRDPPLNDAIATGCLYSLLTQKRVERHDAKWVATSHSPPQKTGESRHNPLIYGQLILAVKENAKALTQSIDAIDAIEDTDDSADQ